MQEASLFHAEDVGMMTHDYAAYESRPAPAGNTQLWVVHDDYIENPTKRFEDVATSPLAEQAYNTDGPLSSSALPTGLIKFVEDTCRQFGVNDCSDFVETKDVVWAVFRYLDYNDPYYLFVDSAVQLTTDNMKYTYRRRRNGEVFAPDRTETFKAVVGWDFKPFRALCELITYPTTQQILKTGQAPHPTVRNRTLMKHDITNKMSQILWGSTSQVAPRDPADTQTEDGLDACISDWMDTYYDHVMWGLHFGCDDRRRADSCEDLPKIELVMQQDRAFWKICVLAVFGWLRSPFAMKFLIDYHPIYQSLLDWDDQTRECTILPETGGEAIVVEWEIYTHQHVNLIENEPPGTCGRCQHPLHCSKYVNVTALSRNDCSCRFHREIDPLDADFYGHDYDCQAKRTANFQFACQRCLNELVAQRTLPKCERVSCRNTGCPWHIGMQAHLRELTRRRTLLLTTVVSPQK